MKTQLALIAALAAVAFSSSASAGVLKPAAVNASAVQRPNADELSKSFLSILILILPNSQYFQHDLFDISKVQIGQASYFQYKFEQEYENNEFCIWSVVTPGNVWKTVLVTIEENGFEPNFDGVEGFHVYEGRSQWAELVKVSP